MTKRFISQGHLIDSGILTRIFALVVDEGASYEINYFDIGRRQEQYSTLELDVTAPNAEALSGLTEKLNRLGCHEKQPAEARWTPAPADRCVPDDFYSTTNHRTQVYARGAWLSVARQRMDAVIVRLTGGTLECRKLRDVKGGDLVLCSPEAVRVFPPFEKKETDVFGFMGNEVSSERSVDVLVANLANELARNKNEGGRVVAVAGPVVVHTGGGPTLAALVRDGYIGGLLSGNALAVHDLESVFYGTSLGVELATGRPTHEGHRNHMRAINRIYAQGSISCAIESGDLDSGIMFEVVRRGIPYCLAGSIRDDGPLPETVTDMITAQRRYAEILEGATMVLMLSSMLHGIGTGNMLPSWVRTVCVDINPAVVTKLADRGSGQAVGIVSDVGLVLRNLAERLSRS